jgi:hypothetical protein
MARSPFADVASCAALAACLSNSSASPVAAQDNSLLTYFYSSGNEQVPVSIALDEIGIVTAQGVAPQAVIDWAGNQGLAAREVGHRLVVIELGGALSRSDLNNEVRKLKAGSLMVHTGLVVYRERSKAPMFVTDYFIAKFRNGVDDSVIQSFNSANHVEIAMADPFVARQYVLRVTPDSVCGSLSPCDALEMSNRYHEAMVPNVPGTAGEVDIVELAHPDFALPIVPRSALPDPHLHRQWHLNNAGLSAGTRDADIDATEAWGISEGQSSTVIAVIDGGFDVGHPDLAANVWRNLNETVNGADDDGNSYVDDVKGWDFTGCEISTSGCGDPGVDGTNDIWGAHGTPVGGAVAAIKGNDIGMAGSCPGCRLMPLRAEVFVNQLTLAVRYAVSKGATILSNSWGFEPGNDPFGFLRIAIDEAATNGRGNLGIPVFFAMSSTGAGWVPDCTNGDYSGLSTVIAVSASTNRDERAPAGYGDCMDMVAPTDGGSLYAATTDVRGPAGWNSTMGGCPGGEIPGTLDYTQCFGGTSFAAPVTAGVAGLVLSARPSLSRLEVQRLLQDTADRIEDSNAQYDPITGFSRPAAPPGPGLPAGSTHGWGRLNAFEAVRVASAGPQGRDGVDLYLRDNRLDWGNTEQPSNYKFERTPGFIPHFESMDIKVDAPPYATAPTTSIAFDAMADENPRSGVLNRAFVRVRNRGPATAVLATVKLYWAYAGTGLPPLPTDFWTAFPNDSADTSEWHPLACAGSASTSCSVASVPYSGASFAGTALDNAQIVAFDFPGPNVPAGAPSHFCMFAAVHSAQDAIPTPPPGGLVLDAVTPRSNNVTQRNYTVEAASAVTSSMSFLVRNPTRRRRAHAVLRVEAPRGWKVDFDKFPLNRAFPLEPDESVLISLEVRIPESDEESGSGDVTIIQETWTEGEPIVGGMTFRFLRKDPRGPVR